MPSELLLALAGYALVMSMTPGPNNLMLLTSGVNFGFRRTIPHMLGVGMRLHLHAAPRRPRHRPASPGQSGALHRRSNTRASPIWPGSPGRSRRAGLSTRATPRPPASRSPFIEAALFQWLNPKGWAAALTATTAFTIPAQLTCRAFLSSPSCFTAATVPSVTTWTAFGIALRGVLAAPRNVRVFNILMALLLMASMLPLAWELV